MVSTKSSGRILPLLFCPVKFAITRATNEWTATPSISGWTYGETVKAPVVEDLNWSIVNNWTPTEYTVSTPNANGWLNSAFVITPKADYKVSLANTANGPWEAALTYNGETADGSVTFYLKNEADGTISLEKTVTYKLDKTPATGKVEFVERSALEALVNALTFDRFFKEEVTVKATASDDLSGVASVEYFASETAMTLNEVKAAAEWTAMPEDGVPVPVKDGKQFVYFVRITDNAGNETYLFTDGAEYDTKAPVISGIKKGRTYYTEKTVTVTDRNLDTVTVNGELVSDPIVLSNETTTTYTVVAPTRSATRPPLP